MKLTIILLVILTSTMGCTSSLLQCGVDGDSSYVTVNAQKALITEGGRNLAELCNFNETEQINAT